MSASVITWEIDILLYPLWCSFFSHPRRRGGQEIIHAADEPIKDRCLIFACHFCLTLGIFIPNHWIHVAWATQGDTCRSTSCHKQTIEWFWHLLKRGESTKCGGDYDKWDNRSSGMSCTFNPITNDNQRMTHFTRHFAWAGWEWQNLGQKMGWFVEMKNGRPALVGYKLLREG